MEQLSLQSIRVPHILNLGKLGFQCVQELGQYNYQRMRESKEMHLHEKMLEIYFLDKGSQYYSINGMGYRMKGGDFLLTFPGEEHGTKQFPQEKGRFFWLMITVPEPADKKRLLNLTRKETGELMHRLLQLRSNRMFRGYPAAMHDLNKIFEVYKEKESIYKKIQINSLLLGFILNVLECGEKSVDNQVTETISQICRFIQNNLEDDLELETLAGECNLSLSHFKYRFKRETGIPPADYILRQKITLAKEMLQQNQSVHDVAYGLAFSSASYFSTVFKRYTRKTPTQFIIEESVY